MRFNCGADLRPTRGVDPDTAILYRELCGGRIFDKFWHLKRARSPSFAAGGGDQFGKTRGDERGRVGFAVAFDRRTQELRHAMQDLHGSIFGVAAETNHCGDVEIEFPKRLRQTVRGPELFLARNPGAGTEITHQIGLGQNDSRRAIHF
ncbi:MAG: hypothetical protein Udaeo_02720 [Candidatus Udaeobacter sp.]|nr:MAG: hypothetical protein Udaeo_02720 [Candidatus Udaeobacter sp.]